jgi:hypothetical protein
MTWRSILDQPYYRANAFILRAKAKNVPIRPALVAPPWRPDARWRQASPDETSLAPRGALPRQEVTFTGTAERGSGAQA